MKKVIIYEYRILMLKNGLNEVDYIPQLREIKRFVDRFFDYLNGDNKWRDINQHIKVPKVRNKEERFNDAKECIDKHKQSNTWIEQIIKV